MEYNELIKIFLRLNKIGVSMCGLAEQFAYEYSNFKKELDWIKYDLLDFEEEQMDDADSFGEEVCYVYYILNSDKSMVKIGVSKNPVLRAKQMQTAIGDELEILKEIMFNSRGDAFDAERYLHEKFCAWRKHPSKVSKSSEWFDARIVKDLIDNYSTMGAIQKDVDRWHKEMQEQLESIEIAG